MPAKDVGRLQAGWRGEVGRDGTEGRLYACMAACGGLGGRHMCVSCGRCVVRVLLGLTLTYVGCWVRVANLLFMIASSSVVPVVM